MMLTSHETIRVSKMALLFLGTWEDAKKRFDLAEDCQVVNLRVGTQLKSSLPDVEFKNRLAMLEQAGKTKQP